MTEIFSFISTSFIPIITLLIVLYGLSKKAPIYDYFIEGAKDGLKMSVEILPFLIGIFLAVNSLTASGILNLIDKLFSPFFDFLNIPAKLLPLIFLRSISGSGSYIILQDI